jgi:O-antigen/teichoic acid export membrane protein
MDRLGVRRLTITAVAIASSGATTLLFNVAAARTLSAISFGEVAREFSVAMLVAQLTMAGMAPALMRHSGQGDGDEKRWSRARGGIPLLCLSSLMCALAYPLLALAGLAPVSAASLIAGCAVAVVYPIYFGLKSFLFVLNRVETYAKLEFTTDALFYAILATLLAIASSWAVASFALAYGCFVGVAIRVISRRASIPSKVRLDKPLLSYAGFAMLGTYASVARFPAIVAATGIVVGTVASGHISALLALITPLLLIPQAASILTFATYARVRGPNETGDLSATLRLTFTGAMIPIVIGVIASHFIVTTIYGPSYGALAPAFAVLLLGLGPMVAGMPIGNALAGSGHVRLTAAVAIPGFLLTVAMACAGGALDGASGILLGCALGVALNGLVLAIISIARLNVHLDDFLGGLLLMGVGGIGLVEPYAALAAGLAMAAGVVVVRLRTREARLS